MQREESMFLRRRQTIRLLGGIALLFFHLITATPFTPVLTALLGAADRSHNAIVQSTNHGYQVVLRHECVNWATHRHGLIARALTVFAQRTTATRSDHVVQFANTDTSQQ